MKRLSIIVPIYNVEPFVERCIISLEKQDISHEEYEIICINDGSPDGSRDVVLGMQKNYENIILIDQVNQGVSRARNVGIDHARGKYLLFIDPDDYVDANCFGSILSAIEESEAQVSFLGYTILNEDGTVRRMVFGERYVGRKLSGIEMYFSTHKYGCPDPDRIYAVLLRTDFINHNKLRFTPDVPYLEDGELIARILCLADQCIFYGHSFYQRTTRPGSATISDLFNSAKATDGFLHAAQNLKKFQELQNLDDNQREFLNQPICKFVVLVVDSATKPFSIKRINSVRKDLSRSGLTNLRTVSVDEEFTKLANCYNRSIYHLIINRFVNKKLKALRLLMVRATLN